MKTFVAVLLVLLVVVPMSLSERVKDEHNPWSTVVQEEVNVSKQYPAPKLYFNDEGSSFRLMMESSKPGERIVVEPGFKTVRSTVCVVVDGLYPATINFTSKECYILAISNRIRWDTSYYSFGWKYVNGSVITVRDTEVRT